MTINFNTNKREYFIREGFSEKEVEIILNLEDYARIVEKMFDKEVIDYNFKHLFDYLAEIQSMDINVKLKSYAEYLLGVSLPFYDKTIVEENLENVEEFNYVVSPVTGRQVKDWVTLVDNYQKGGVIIDDFNKKLRVDGVKHPWTREQYEKLADPEVKRDVSYDAYLNMWDSESRKLLPQPEKPKVKIKPKKTYSQGTGIISDPNQFNTARLIDEKDVKYKEPVDYARPIIINNHTHEEATGWKSIRIETRIMIVTMIIGVILSFMTVLILILK